MKATILNHPDKEYDVDMLMKDGIFLYTSDVASAYYEHSQVKVIDPQKYIDDLESEGCKCERGCHKCESITNSLSGLHLQLELHYEKL